MPGEEEARVGSSAQLATTALTTTTTTTSGTGAASSSSSTTSSSAVPKVALPVLALRGTSSSISPAGVTSVSSSSHYPLVSGTSGGGTSSNNSKQQTTGGTIVPISASCPPNNNVNNPTALSNAAGAGILANLNSAVGCSVTVDGGVGLNNNAAAGATTTASNNKKQQQSFHNNPLPGTRPAPLVESNSSGGLLNNFNNKQQQQQIPHLQQPPSSSAALLSSQLSLKPLKVSTTPNGNSSSPPVADAKRDTGTCNGHGGGASHHGGKRIDDDEIDEADDSSKLELQLQFAGIDNETVDVDVEDEENNYEGGSESGPMCTVVPTSKSANGNGGDKPGTPSFPGDLPGGGGGTMVVASSAAAAGSAAPTSTTSSTIGGGGGATGPTNSLAAGGHVAGTTASAAGGSTLGEEEEDEEEDVEGGKTVECTEVVVPEQTFAEKCLFYTTAFFILLAVFSLFAFLFLVPFVIDPAFTTIFMEFDPEPAFCQTVSIEQKAGLSKCNWTSCREGCTREMFQCIQIRVNYRSARKSHSDDFQRRPNNNNNHNLNLRSASGGSSFSLALQDLRGSEHSGSSFKTPFTNNYNNLINLNSHKVRGGGAGSFGAGEMSAYHSASSAGGGGAASTSKLSKAHYKSAMASNLHHASKFAGHGAGDGVAELTSSALTSHNSASARSNGVFMNLKQSKHNRMPGQQLKSAQQSAAPTSGAEPLWDYTEAHLYPNVKGCGYPPVVVCSDFVVKYGSKGTNFSCYYSKVNPAMVVTSYDMSRVIMDLVYSMAIPIPSFIISVVYLIFAYFRIYNTDSSSATQTGGGGRAERLNSSSTTTNLQNPGSANRGGGGSSADDPDAETSISVDDKTCIIQRSTSKGLNALSDKLPNSGKGLHAQVIEMNDLNPQLRHPVDGDVFLPKRNNNCNPPPPHERNGPTNPAAKNKGEEMTAAPTVEAS